MSTKLYADDRCVAEFFSPNELREMAGYDSMDATQNGTYSPSQEDGYKSVVINTDQEMKKKPCNCPNCGAPLTSDICEYCGTEFEKSKKKLSDKEMRESFALAEIVSKQKLIDELKRQQRRSELQASQEWQTQNLLNSLNSYNVNTQIMNMRDSINVSVSNQICSLHDQMHNASMLTNVYPTGRIEHIPINKDDDVKDTPISEADEELATVLLWLMIGMVLFTLFAIGVTWIYNLP